MIKSQWDPERFVTDEDGVTHDAKIHPKVLEAQINAPKQRRPSNIDRLTQPQRIESGKFSEPSEDELRRTRQEKSK